MQILETNGWNDYELIDSGNGQRLERFGKYTLIRPDPQIIWQKRLQRAEWLRADAIFKRTSQDKGEWIFNKQIPKQWTIELNGLKFWVKLSPFKHTGVFPEQITQWEWMKKVIQKNCHPEFISGSQKEIPKQVRNDKMINILNLFAYTGISTLVCAKIGAKVTHIDASKPAVTWAKENQLASELQDKPIRWIIDDAMKFCEREVKRGIKYDGIIMDPPIFGHGPTGTMWKFNEHFPKLLEICISLLSDNPLFILVNAYAISSSALMLQNVLEDFTKSLGGKIEIGELALQEKENKRLLSTGIFARWSS